jgi:hypothetical protein
MYWMIWTSATPCVMESLQGETPSWLNAISDKDCEERIEPATLTEARPGSHPITT